MFGVVLVLAYGIGMAATLTLAGVLLVRLRDRMPSEAAKVGDERSFDAGPRSPRRTDSSEGTRFSLNASRRRHLLRAVPLRSSAVLSPVVSPCAASPQSLVGVMRPRADFVYGYEALPRWRRVLSCSSSSMPYVTTAQPRPIPRGSDDATYGQACPPSSARIDRSSPATCLRLSPRRGNNVAA